MSRGTRHHRHKHSPQKREAIKLKERVLRKTGGRCAYCGRKLTIETMTIDHVRPKSKGGYNRTKNYLPACEACNRDKADTVGYPRAK